MGPIDYRPASGGGSCVRCRDSLGLISVKVNGAWYCGTVCAEGRDASAPSSVRVPEPRLYARPRRFHRKRAPVELRTVRRD